VCVCVCVCVCHIGNSKHALPEKNLETKSFEPLFRNDLQVNTDEVILMKYVEMLQLLINYDTD
jgi:hypothetical protein